MIECPKDVDVFAKENYRVSDDEVNFLKVWQEKVLDESKGVFIGWSNVTNKEQKMKLLGITHDYCDYLDEFIRKEEEELNSLTFVMGRSSTDINIYGEQRR